MIDLHTHILAGFDDGASDLETAVAMLQMAYENKTTAVVLTPHVIEYICFPTWDEILAGCELLRQESHKAGLQIEIYPGAEVYMGMDILQLLLGPGPYCINSGRYLLVELPMHEIPLFADQFFLTLQDRGIVPILAHPERHLKLAKNPVILQDWIRKGIMTQLNGESLLGRLGEQVRATAHFFLLNNLVHFIGSDAHGLNFRQPKLLEANTQIINLVGERQAQQFLIENPKRVLVNAELKFPFTKEF